MGAQADDFPRIRVAAFMLWEDKLVLVRHMKDGREYFLLPGGGVEWGETLLDALKREVLEETGILCSPIQLMLLHDSIAPDDTRHVVNIVFSAQIDDFPHYHASSDDRVIGVDLVTTDCLASLELRPPIAPVLIASLQANSDFTPRYTGSDYI